VTRLRLPWQSDDNTVVGYRLLQEIGAGGFSTVHVAEDLGVRRRVALKIARSRDRGTQERFATEAAIGERLAAARGIVGTLQHTRTKDGRPVLVMPYYDLGNAAALLPDGHRLSLTAVVDLIQDVAQGLDTMHRQHYLHRDITPRNILRSSELGSALGDLGCARPFNSTWQPPWTEALTPAYAAPEALAADGVQTIASDVYGLAATTWALFTGLPPDGQTAGVPEAAAQILIQALDPDPARRPGRVLDLSEALATAIPTPAPAATSISGVPGPIQPSSVRPASDRLPSTPASDPAEPENVSSGLRRGPLIVAMLAAFIFGFALVRMF